MSRTEPPSVLAVLVVRDGAAWLRECLQGLAAQRHPRLGVLAVDNASRDGSREILAQALGTGRVLELRERAGVAGSLRAALDTPAATEADYLLVLHDDTVLESGAVDRMIEAAEALADRGAVGIVGPKVVDWDDPRVLREVGRSTDRFGHPTTPLQDGEVDHGQYDRVREVLFVSSCAMLVSREAWQRTGPPDERLDHREDLDFCWRARLAGFRVLMTPLAQARHRAASDRGERVEEHRLRGPRYYGERAGIAAVLKNYGLASLLWLFPLYVALAAGRILLLAAERRFEDALEVLAAWGWNVIHLPGTIARRVRAQSVRAAPDRAIRVFMEPPASRLPRWLETAGRIIEEQRGIDEDEELHLGRHARSIARAHPVLAAWVVAVLVGIVAHRRLLGPEILQGGALPVFPDAPRDFFGELTAGFRSTGLGGAQAGSPALAVLGGLSVVLLGSTALAQKVILIALPGVAGVALYRALARQTRDRAGAVLGAAAYSLSALTLWAFSEGRIGLLVAMAVLPVVGDRLEVLFGAERPKRVLRLVVGAGAALAIGLSFFPGVLVAAALLVAVHVVASRRRLRGLVLTGGAFAAGAALAFPIVGDLVREPAAALWSPIGTTRFADLARLVLGPAPGGWTLAWFLPAAALLSFTVVADEYRGRGLRALLAVLAALFLAWGSAAGYLPRAVSNPMAYLAVAASAMAGLVGLGASSVLSLGRESFGLRQIAAGALSLVLAAGLAMQALATLPGSWTVGPLGLPPAWPVVVSAAPPDARVLWLGRASGRRFPAPGGDPQGIVEAGQSSVRYALTGVDGITALDVGRWEAGRGYLYAEQVMTELLSGRTVHVGAMLAPLSVRYVVAETGDLPGRVIGRLGEQLDLDLVPAEGLLIYSNPAALPVVSTMSRGSFDDAAQLGDLSAIAEGSPSKVRELGATADGWTGTAAGGGLAFIGLEFDPGLRLTSQGAARPEEAFGWGNGFPVSEGTVTVRREERSRGPEMVALGVLWLAALWLTRRPAAR